MLRCKLDETFGCSFYPPPPAYHPTPTAGHTSQDGTPCVTCHPPWMSPPAVHSDGSSVVIGLVAKSLVLLHFVVVFFWGQWQGRLFQRFQNRVHDSFTDCWSVVWFGVVRLLYSYLPATWCLPKSRARSSRHPRILTSVEQGSWNFQAYSQICHAKISCFPRWAGSLTKCVGNCGRGNVSLELAFDMRTIELLLSDQDIHPFCMNVCAPGSFSPFGPQHTLCSCRKVLGKKLCGTSLSSTGNHWSQAASVWRPIYETHENICIGYFSTSRTISIVFTKTIEYQKIYREAVNTDVSAQRIGLFLTRCMMNDRPADLFSLMYVLVHTQCHCDRAADLLSLKHSEQIHAKNRATALNPREFSVKWSNFHSFLFHYFAHSETH